MWVSSKFIDLISFFVFQVYPLAWVLILWSARDFMDTIYTDHIVIGNINEKLFAVIRDLDVFLFHILYGC